MGCGGSRADAIEPRYYESWTRETESTWLTNTDAEPPQQALPAAGPESGAAAEASLKSPGESAKRGVEGRPSAATAAGCQAERMLGLRSVPLHHHHPTNLLSLSLGAGLGS
ncbi:hypothetical protein E2320_011613 [Naja naja]|nr:hypothetical protein E2320_011613 [Naja naja]